MFLSAQVQIVIHDLNRPVRGHHVQGFSGRAFLTGLCIYGSALEFFDQTWIPDDVVKLKYKKIKFETVPDI